MHIKTTQEALYVACEMERNAMHLYQRAMVLLKEMGRAYDPVYERLALLYADEKRHLQMFEELYVDREHSVEDQLMLSAIASNVLFQGGLMGAVRAGLLDSIESTMDFAIQEEEKASQTYQSFAEKCEDEAVRAVLESISKEEKRHLRDLRHQAVVGA